MGVYVYILKIDNKSFYTGITKNMVNRLNQHLSRQSISTKFYKEMSLMYCTVLDSYSLARKLEVKIKNLGAKKYLSRVNFTGQVFNFNYN